MKISSNHPQDLHRLLMKKKINTRLSNSHQNPTIENSLILEPKFNLIEIFIENESYDEAIRKTLDLMDQCVEKRHLYKGYSYLSVIYSLMGNYKLEATFKNMAMDEIDSSNYTNESGILLNKLGRIHFKKGALENAEKCFITNLCDLDLENDQRVNALEYLAQIYKKQNKPELAKKYIAKKIAIRA